MNQLATFTRTKPVTILATLHALLGVLIAFGVLELDGGQLAAVEAVFAAVGFGSASQVTANTRLSPEAIAEATPKPWAGSLTNDDTVPDIG